jgi:mono/diheme cytochrome c family protein
MVGIVGKKRAFLLRRWRWIAGVAILALVGVLALLHTMAGPDALDFAGGRRVSLANYQGPDPTGVPPELKNASLVERGEYLARAADCEVCHTARGGVPYAGGLAFATPFGTLYSTNLTPDKATGIGDYTDAEFLNALHKGVRRDGARLYPAMPYDAYSYMTDNDALAIKAFLFSLAPARGPSVADNLSFPFNQRWLMAIWSSLFNPDQRYQPNADRSPQWNRGAYLVEALGHCGDCHTPRNIFEALDNRRKFAGGVVDNWRVYDITADHDTGVGDWSAVDLSRYLSTGHADGHGTATGPMEAVETVSLTHMTAGDISAIVAYLRTIPAIAMSDVPAVKSAPLSSGATAVGDARGQALFEHVCAACHGANGVSPLTPFATLTGSRAVNDPTGTNVAQMILFGAGGYKTMMPAFAEVLSDDDIAIVTNYVTGQFGAKASAVSPAFVAGLRAPAPQAPTQSAIAANFAPHPSVKQPIPFSHKLHVGFGLECTSCHANPKRSADMSLPQADTCMTCHAAIARDHPDIERLAEFAASNKTIPWERVYPLTPGIAFDHGPHLRAGVQCATCHGAVADQTAMSELTTLTSMATCISCHQALQAKMECVTCHKWPNNDPNVLGEWASPAPVPFEAAQTAGPTAR